MEVASRPPLEALHELPVEESLDSAKPRAEPAAASGTSPGAPTEPGKPKDPEQTGLNFVDPEMFLAPGQASTAIPVVNATEQSHKAPEPALELVLEDPVVDELLTAPPAPAPPAAAPPARAGQAAPKAEPAADPVAERAAARVPIAKTASLSAAATKLAAASGAPRPATKPSASRKPDAAPVPASVPTAQPATKAAAAAKTAAAPSKPASTATTPKAEEPAPKMDAPSLASWASARAAASPKVRPSTAPSAGAPSQSGASAPKSASSRSTSAPSAAFTSGLTAAQAPMGAPPAAAAPSVAASSTVPPAPVMDRDFIARNQVVERYLSGRLPLKAATEFERFCRDHGELLDEIGLPERVNAGLRLLEASGKPEPWQEAPRPVWQKPQVTLGLAIAVAVLGMTLTGVAANSSSKSHRIAELQKQNSERALDPATSTREIRLLPSRSGASNAPAITIGGGPSAQLVDLKIDESRSAYRVFRVTVDRIDQGRVAVISNLEKDSNGHLRIALNSSALGPGNYQLTLEGLDWRGQPQPDSWVTIGIQR
ncbi:MAG TPA: hypothetical protein VGN03_11320 [Steroidobacteraceae bacterium]